MSKEQIREIIKTTLNQCFCDYGQKLFRKYFFLEMNGGRVEAVVDILNEWSGKGFLRMIKPFNEALETEDCVEMLKPIEWE